jgi:hypothetical protein
METATPNHWFNWRSRWVLSAGCWRIMLIIVKNLWKSWWMRMVATREDAKNYFIITIYGRVWPMGWNEKHRFNKCVDIVKIQTCRRNLKNWNGCINLELTLKIYNTLYLTLIRTLLKSHTNKRAWKTDYNIVGTVCSYVLQEWEVRVLECV